jgi:IgA Peptidase M64
MRAHIKTCHWALSAVLLILCLSQIASAEPFETIINNGSAANRVDIVILGDGYTSSQMNKYKNDVQAAMMQFFNNEPFREYRNFFNVHRIDVVSSQSGADHPERASFVNTALDATYNCTGIQRAICVNNGKVFTILGNSVTPSQRDIMLVIVNDEEYGGSGGSVAVTSTHVEVLELILHELGHSFGLLADEYGGPPPPACNSTVEPSAVNATKVTDRALIKWNHWIDASTPIPTLLPLPGVPGLYVGAVYCDAGLYRPTSGSKMRLLGRPYEQINTEQLIKRIYNLVSPIDDSQPTATDITLTTAQSQAFSVTSPVTFSNTIKIDWFLDGVFQSSGTGFTVSNLISGSHVVDAVVKDNTSLVRKDTGNLLSESRRWNLTVNSVPTPTPTPTPIPSPTPAPILLLEENSSRGVALDSVTWLRDPFSVFSSRNFSADGRTRIVLFAMNVEVQAGENLSIISASAEDAQQTIYPLVVEYAGNVPNQNWMAQIVVLLPENLANAGNVLVSIKVRGLQSNKVLVNIRPP